MDAYINLRYSTYSIIVDYFLSKDIRNNLRTVGLSASSKDFEETKDNLKNLVKDSHEKEIIISRKLRSRLKKYSRFGLQRLKEIKKVLSNHRPDITFKLAT